MSAKHINANSGDFAEFLLLPGDPLRAKYIADKYLDDAVQVANVRGMLGFTGVFEGQPVSVMGSGMGMPSASIYCHELISGFGVKEIIRIGSCGTLSTNIQLRDIVIAMGACTDSNINRIRFGGYDYAAIADYSLLERGVTAARRSKRPVQVGNVFSSDLFYTPDPEMFDTMEKYKILGVEMESAGIYSTAAELGARALAMFTVSDHIRTGEALSTQERESTFDDMIQLALSVRGTEVL